MRQSRVGRSLACYVNCGILLTVLAGAAQAAEIEIRNTACRLYDSRHVGGYNTGSAVSSATIDAQAVSLDTVAFSQGGISYNAQGGQAGCRARSGDNAVTLSVLIWSPSASGWGRFWPFGESEPLSTNINSSGGTNENSGVPVTLGEDGRISYHASFTSHLIVELMGSKDGSGFSRESADPPQVTGPRHRRFLTFANAPFLGSGVGDRLIVSASGTVGAFAGHENEWAVWNGDGWEFETPVDGDLAYDASTGNYWRYRGSTAAWGQLALQ